MSYFDEVNKDSLSVPADSVSTGPYAGPLEMFNYAYDAQQRSNSQLMLHFDIGKADDYQYSNSKKYGVEDLPRLSNHPYDLAQFYEDGTASEDTKQFYKNYDDRINGLKQTHPEGEWYTSKEIWQAAKQVGPAAENRLSGVRTGKLGRVAEFFGGMGGSVDPHTSPLNYAMGFAPILGETVPARIALQGLSQGGAEAVNQATGVSESRRLVGLSHGLAEGAKAVAGAAIGGAVMQGATEGVAAALSKRWFTSTPSDPAPPAPVGEAAVGLAEHTQFPETVGGPSHELPSPEHLALQRQAAYDNVVSIITDKKNFINSDTVTPYGSSRLATARAIMDTDHVAAQLQAWDGPLAHEIVPPTATRVPNVDARITPDIRAAPFASLDELARMHDPNTFRIFDALTQEKNSYRAQIENIKPDKVELTAQIDDLSDKIDGLRSKLYENKQSGSKRAVATESRLNDMLSQREELVKQAGGQDTPVQADLRRRLMEADYKQRDLAPVVARAYAQSKGQWSAGQSMHDRIRNMIRQGSGTLPETNPSGIAASYEEAVNAHAQTMTDKAPILQQSDKVAGKMREDSTPLDTAIAIMKENAKVMDEAMSTYSTSINKVLSDKKGASNEISVAGHEYKLHLDKDTIVVPNENGKGSREITIRQLLEEQQLDEDVLKATKKCSI